MCALPRLALSRPECPPTQHIQSPFKCRNALDLRRCALTKSQMQSRIEFQLRNTKHAQSAQPSPAKRARNTGRHDASSRGSHGRAHMSNTETRQERETKIEVSLPVRRVHDGRVLWWILVLVLDIVYIWVVYSGCQCENMRRNGKTEILLESLRERDGGFL